MKRLTVGFFLFVLATLLMVSASVYGSGNGVVIEGNPVGTDGIGSLNPVLCNNPYCRRITDFLFPTLYAVDPASGLPAAASDDNFGLAVDVNAPIESPGRVRLRDDLAWSDGTPITAYDVFYSYLAITSPYVNSPFASISSLAPAARVVDEHTIEFAYDETNCTIPARTSFPIIPAHVFDPDFRQAVDNFNADGDITAWYKGWLDFYPPTGFVILNNHAFNTAPTVTAGLFRFAQWLPGEEIRLATHDGDIAFIYRDIKSGMDQTQFFLDGGSNILVNPPYESRDDLLANPELKITQTPGSTWDFIAFNLANSGLPRSAFNGDGVPLEQGQHSIFGDIRVRHAIQKAINVDELIEAALSGYGTPIASSRISGTWAANESLKSQAYDPRGAEHLLEEAGWRDVDEDGVRECVNCLYADKGRSLFFDMMVVSDGRREIAANLIARQLLEVGIGLNVRVIDASSVFDEARYQQFDTYMGGWTQRYPTEPDQTTLFSRASDVLYTGNNVGSYFNPQVDQLMAQARNLPGCDAQARADIYRDIQATLQEDQPYIWLYAAQDMVAAKGIVGFAPYANNPFWNIGDWIVVP
ncbi:MAG: ABC transporter substrate-binding protein [Chloroflexota bacterium]